MTGCRQSDRFTASFWLCGSFQARPLPWVHCSHVISEKITLSATTDNERLYHPDRINGHLREVQGLIQNELTLECQVKSELNYREMGGVGGGFFFGSTSFIYDASISVVPLSPDTGVPRCDDDIVTTSLTFRRLNFPLALIFPSAGSTRVAVKI